MSAVIPSDNTVKFNTHPHFTPHYTPREMLELGVFGGAHFHWISRQKKVDPKLFEGLDKDNYMAMAPASNRNYFGSIAERTFKMFSDNLDDYPGGWFTWYSIFYYHPEMTNESDNGMYISFWQEAIKRFWFYVKDNQDLEELTPYRQALLELGWDSTKEPTW